MFPRAYGLRSCFDTKDELKGLSGIKFDEREKEIKALGALKTPKKIKSVIRLIEEVIRNHSRVDYRRLLDQHCPRRLGRGARNCTENEKTKDSLLEAEPHTQISKNEVSLEVSHPSLVVPHGAREAKEAVRLQPKFSEYTIAAYEVESYVKAIALAIFPADLWGSDTNWDIM
ncbi:hypothetical protein BT69DRAFT_109616 [Atractiella rhizophila]|nr:hypothetical protein BT69DRAFT_109616 [Atractiella rhizophila]